MPDITTSVEIYTHSASTLWLFSIDFTWTFTILLVVLLLNDSPLGTYTAGHTDWLVLEKRCIYTFLLNTYCMIVGIQCDASRPMKESEKRELLMGCCSFPSRVQFTAGAEVFLRAHMITL